MHSSRDQDTTRSRRPEHETAPPQTPGECQGLISHSSFLRGSFHTPPSDPAAARSRRATLGKARMRAVGENILAPGFSAGVPGICSKCPSPPTHPSPRLHPRVCTRGLAESDFRGVVFQLQQRNCFRFSRNSFHPSATQENSQRTRARNVEGASGVARSFAGRDP